MWRALFFALMTGVAAWGLGESARAQTAQPAPKAAAKPAAPAAKTEAKSEAKTEAKTAAKPESKPAGPAAAVAGGAEPTLIGQFGTWGAYAATPNGKKVCFALAKPSSSKTNPPNRPRDPAYAFVSTRPAEKVNNEVSVMIGYALKPGSESTVEVGGASFAMYTQGDGLWIKNAAEEERMVEAMRKSADLVVKGVSAKGTETTDTFSLKGLAQALDKIAQDCRR
ncbi:invasion associated locus B family protein [Bradyrhizobium manausense]|uniref:Invasion associated locus B family protein n=1 Tax=Bradyrhizobium manausense TaxID=989370 RepID=A0A0R3EAN6_9BRAD|nr:invasion associated locus B family protein [Bradyrhizobium manausense]KRQ17533.1 Invasion associated locus B family protein [Bradyrhizobium manausense]